MIQTPVLDSAQPTVKDLNDNGPYHTASTPKTQGISANLRDRLENQKNSETLNLADMFLGDEGAHELAESLHHHGDFASIQLRGNNISAAGFAAICQHLHNCPKLRELAAEWNNIGSDPAGVAALHKFARTSNSLQVIDLKNNRIGPNCGKAIGDLIRDSNSLSKLDLRWNELGEEGGQQILNALQDSRKKIAFELNGNRIPEQILVQINQFSSSGAGRTAAPTVTAATTVNAVTSPTATKITIFDQPAKRMAQLTGERLFQSQFGQTAAAQKEEKQHKNIVDDFTNKPQHHEPYSLGNTLPNKYSNINTVTHATTASNENRFGTTSKKTHEKTDYISDKYIYNSTIHGAGSHGHGPAHTLRVDTHSDVRTVTLGQDNFSSASLREGGLSQKYSYAQEIKAKTYSSPLRGLEGDVDAQIETTKKNIERYSPTHKGRLANAHEFRHERHETMSRPSYEMKTEVVRRSGTKVDSPPVREDKGSSSIHQKYKSGTQTSEFRTESMRRSAGVTHEHDVHSVQTRHVVDDGSLKVGKLISDLERTVEIEREKAREAQMKLDAALRDLEIESRGRQEAEKKHSYILEELRRRDVEVNELRIKVDGLSQDNNGLSLEVRSVRAENEKLAEFNRVGMAEIEEKYIRQLKQADEHSRSLRDQLGSVQRDLSMQIVEIRTDYDGRIRNYDEQVREFSRLNDELSNELANQLEFIEKLKVEQEENLKRTILEVREEEVRRAQPVIRQLEDEVRTLKITNEDLTAKNAEMLHDLQTYERQMREQHMQFATELNRLGSEHDRIRGELNQANITIQRLNGEISMRNTTIKNLEGDIDRLRMEIQRQADMYVSQIENLKRDFESERRRFAEQERQLIYKIEDTERRLVESQNETVIITREYDRLVEIMQGNVSKAIHDTFVTHKHTSEIRHIEHKSVPVRSVLDERQVLATSRVFNTAEKKYM